MASFTSLYSGSSGNAALVGCGDEYLCVDMGKNCKTTLAALHDAQVEPQRLQGILVTHEHRDHIAGLKVFLKKYAIPVYGSSATLNYLAEYDLVQPSTVLIPLEGKSDQIGSFEVASFATSHDAVDCHGYRITTADGRQLALATDLGWVSESVYNNLQNADLVVLEANYDAMRLKNGPYPYYLKNRIASARGHLCNTDCAAALARLLAEGCERFALCHLSNENNTPELARGAVHQAFEAQGAQIGQDGLLKTLSRHMVTAPIEF